MDETTVKKMSYIIRMMIFHHGQFGSKDGFLTTDQIYEISRTLGKSSRLGITKEDITAMFAIDTFPAFYATKVMTDPVTGQRTYSYCMETT